MPTAVTAAVARSARAPFVLERFELADPLDDEVLVRIAAVGLCHTDVKAREGGLPVPFPVVLGHEGAGIVERVGARVTQLAPGDHVVLCSDYCGVCAQCRRGRMAYCVEHGTRNFTARGPGQPQPFSRDGERVHGMFFGQSSFATYALAHETNAINVRADVPIEELAPLGCGVLTGAGVVLNVLRPEPGSSIAILGTGAVGSSALLAAVLSGCTTIAAVDVYDTKLAAAERLGATHRVRAGDAPVAEQLRAIHPTGFDFVFDTTGHGATIEQGFEALTVRGTIGLVAGTPGGRLDLDLQHVYHRGLTIRGIIQGDSVPSTFIPRLVDLYAGGKFPFDRMLTRYPLAEVERAIDDVHAGTTVKALLIPS